MPQQVPVIGYRLSEEETKALRLAAEVVEWLRANSPLHQHPRVDRHFAATAILLVHLADIEAADMN